jgi:CubicO group peptidase (beta-lactamase class C family)
MRDWVDRLADVGRARPDLPHHVQDHSSFDRFVDEEVAGRVTPGLAVATFDRDGVRHARGYGVRVAGEREACGADTPFRWFSITKVVTAMVALRLVEAGRLDLMEPVAERLPWFERVDPDHRVTVEDLLRHRSGIGNPPPFTWGRPAEAPGWDVRTEVRRATLRQRPIDSRRHGTPSYTNLGYLVLGEVIREAADEPLEALAEREILEPLSLDATEFGPGPRADAALPHELTLHPRPWVFATFAGAPPGGWAREIGRLRPLRFVDGRVGGFVRVHPFRLMGAAFGDLSGSVSDLARLGVAHLRDGDDVLTSISAKRMREGREGYGLGWHVEDDVVGHTGSGIGYRSELRIVPERGLGVAVLANVGHIDTTPLADALLAIEASA